MPSNGTEIDMESAKRSVGTEGPRYMTKHVQYRRYHELHDGEFQNMRRKTKAQRQPSVDSRISYADLVSEEPESV